LPKEGAQPWALVLGDRNVVISEPVEMIESAIDFCCAIEKRDELSARKLVGRECRTDDRNDRGLRSSDVDGDVDEQVFVADDAQPDERLAGLNGC
jgi:hypothetical protein